MAQMVRISIKGFDKLKKSVKEVFNHAIDREVLLQVGKTISDMNKKNIRAGLNPYARESQWGDTKFPPLSKSWKERRKRLSEFNDTGQGFSPNKSNLTLTGQLVESIGALEVDESKKSVTVELHNSTRRPYIGVKGKPLKSGAKTNKELGSIMSKKGLIFLGFTVQMKKVVNEIIYKSVRGLLKRFK